MAQKFKIPDKEGILSVTSWVTWKDSTNKLGNSYIFNNFGALNLLFSLGFKFVNTDTVKVFSHVLE